MKLRKLVVVASLVFVSVSLDISANDLCYEKADPALSALKSWRDLRSWYEKYSVCDDGYFGEGLSEFVVVSLAKNWQSLPSLQGEIRKNRAFKDFVLKHIDASTDESDVRTIINNAKDKCPENLQSLCVEIEKNAEITLREMGGMTK